ncbi:cytochrome P450 89A2-like [Cucumis melo var. makuwa]|uniref:Cytochrome P450 89A2-like n=1 Tax=Cucumis melo var. makuwa TaxID=1194695 RepID=A0A5A7TNM2_CUCMM|nr:cytochrome P450 89A2-like [Cucumis melo var. makuwa]TYK06504.1 cytochrome P450 89A2-like [Cucumis melo var. makuwa]
MEIWFIILVSLCISSLLTSIFTHFRTSSNLPPGPPSIPIFTNFLWLRRSPLQIESLLRSFVTKYGPVVTLPIGNHPVIFIADRSIAHKALFEHGALFADRPPAPPLSKVISSNQYNISSASYGPLWRLLRRNLTSHILHSSRIRFYSQARKWVLDILLSRLQSHSQSKIPVLLVENFQYAMFCLLVLMCFGDKLEESQIREVEKVERELILSFQRFNIFNFWPKFTKILLRKRWEAFLQIRKNQENVLNRLIEERRKANKNRATKAQNEEKEEFVVSYVDTLLDLELPNEDNRKLSNEEIVTLCSEFLNAGTDTTSTALQWIMANIVKNPKIQNKLLAEMKGILGNGSTEDEVKEEDLEKLPYLKAVVLEGLRRHPPGHFVLPHAVKEDTIFENYMIPKNGTVNFMVAEMGLDPKVWEDPMVFKPERFLKGGEGEGVVFDITGSKEIKMMPFGAGRRMCPGFVLAILHLEYFIANLVWRFEWKEVKGDEVRLEEKIEFTVVMEKPLKADIIPR